MKAVVTGGTGFIGTSLVAELLRRGWDVECLSRRVPASSTGLVKYRSADLCDPPGMAAALCACGDVSVLFHLAAALPTHTPAPDNEMYVRANVLAPLRLFERALEMGVGRVVFASTVTVIGEPTERPIVESHRTKPTSSYAVTKLGGEHHAETLRQTRGLRIASLRISSCYGPEMNQESVVPKFARAAVKGERLAWFGSGNRSQNFVHVKDVTRALLLAAEGTATGVFNITGPESISMRALALLMVSLVPGTASAAEAANVPDPEEDQRWEFEASRAKAELGYAPAIALREGLADYVHCMAHAEQARDARGAHLGHSR